MPFRTKNTYSTSRGTYNTRRHTFSGKGKGPAGMRKVKAPTARTTPIVTRSPRGKVTTSGFNSRAAARSAKREAIRARQRAVKAVKAVEKATASRPIATLQHAEAKLARHPDAQLRESAKRLRHALAAQAVSKARIPTPEGSGGFPKAELRKVAPRAYKKAFKAALHAGSSGGATADPIAELAISTAATAGLGLGAKAIGFGAKTAAEEAASSLASKAAPAEDAGIKAAIKRAATKAKSEAEGLKSGSGVRSATARATKASAKRAGRAAEERLPSAENAFKHPLRTNLQVAAVTPATPGGSSIPNRVRTAIRGEARAITHHPGDYLKGGEKAALGFFAAPVGLAGAGVASIEKGSPAPLVATSSALSHGVTQWMGDLFSGNMKRAESAAIQAGPTVFIPGGAILRRLKGTSLYEDAIRGRLRDTVENRRAVKRAIQIEAEKAAQKAGKPIKSKIKEPVEATTREGRPTGQNYVLRRTGKKLEDQKARHEVSRIVSRAQHAGITWGLRDAKPMIEAIRRSDLVGRSTRDVLNAGDAVKLVAQHGLPPNEAVGAPFVETMLKRYPKPTHGDVPASEIVDRHAAQWILKHPQLWRDKGFWDAVKAFKAQSEKVGFSENHRFLPALRNVVNPRREAEGLHPHLAPEEMIPRSMEKLLPKRDKPWNRGEALDYIASQEKRLQGHREAARAAKASERELVADLKQREIAERRRMQSAIPGRPTGSQLKELQTLQALHERGLTERVPVQELSRLQTKTGRPRYRPTARVQARRAALVDAQANALGHAADAKVLARGVKAMKREMKGLMKPESHGGPAKGVLTTRSVRYTPEMVERFVSTMLKEHKRHGLHIPAAHVSDVLPAPGAETAPNYAGYLPPRSVKASSGKAAQSGLASSSFESLLTHSVYQPRIARFMNQAIARVVDRGARKVDGRTTFTRGQMTRAINRGVVPEDTVWVRPQFLKGALNGPHPLDAEEVTALVKGEIKNGTMRRGSGEGAATRAALAAAEGTKGEKFVPVKGAYMRELTGQLEQLPKISRALAKASNASTRTILNSPAFLAVQIPQEGLPLLASMGRDIHRLPQAVRTVLAAHRNLDAEQLAQIKAVAGSSAGVRGAPTMQQLGSLGVMDPVRAAAPKSVWRHVWEVVSGTKTGNFDVNRAGLFREVGMAAKEAGQFARWRRGMKSIYSDINKANEAMKGMAPEQRLAWSASHPKLGDRLMRGMNEAIGNWNSFTAFEKQFAPATIFYSFQRFSVLWMLYHFPLNHPVATTALAWLGQSNAKMLDEVAGSEGKKITNMLQYTYPVIKLSGGKTSKHNTVVLPVGTRIAPGLSSGAQALVEHKPAQLTGALQPAIGLAVSAAYGKDPYTGQPLGENGFEWIARQIVAQSPAGRALNLQNKGKAKGKSTLGEAFAKLGPEQGIGKFVNPFAGQSGAKFAIQVRLEAALKAAAANSTDKQKELARSGKRLKPGTIAQMEAKAERAQTEIGRVLKKLGLSAKDAKEYNLYKRNMEYGGGGVFGGSSGGSLFGGSSGGGLFK